jgi:hypothetical protein
MITKTPQRKQNRGLGDDDILGYRNLHFNGWSRFGGYSKASDNGKSTILAIGFTNG